MGKLTGKVAVVTGASKGIGAAIAKALAAEGAAVVVNYASSKSGADAVVADILSRDGKAAAVQGDVAKAADVIRLFAETDRLFGRLDILVNNAGVFEFKPLGEIDEKHFHKQFDTNVLGLLLATREAANRFGPTGGSVINVGSIVTDLAPPASAVYSATKAAVHTITQVLAGELGSRKIRVNSISPGPVNTEGFRAMGDEVVAGVENSIVAQTPLGRIGQPADIAPVAVFLASDDSAWVTGEQIRASGGVR
jgi:3-oxoacyl-[acyl-carrier protein] reductase